MSERIRRAFHPSVPGPGSVVVLDPDESHHLLRVLRLAAGDRLRVFDGRGGEWQAVLEAARSDSAQLRIGDPMLDPVEAPVRVALHQAITRPERLEWVLQKGTEVGVAEFRLFPAARSDASRPSPGRWERMRRIVLEACKQSGRRNVPAVTEESDPGVARPGARALVLDTRPGTPPLASYGRARADEVHLAIGPEGGFTEEEVRGLEARGWSRAALGRRVLRTETAAIVACALALHLWGDLGAEPAAREGATVDSTGPRP